MAPSQAAEAYPSLPPNSGPTLEALAALDAAIAGARPRFGGLVKDATNSYLNTAYMPLDTILSAVIAPLAAAGVSVTSSLSLVPGGFVVLTSLVHSGGGWRSSMFPVSDPSNSQKVAASATYGLRINLSQLLVITGRDDDGEYGQDRVTLPGEPAPAPAPWMPPAPAPWMPPAPVPAAPPQWTPPAAPSPAPTPYI
jgi:hypothetical protein